MNKLLVLIIICTHSLMSLAIGDYQKGEKVYVWAASGLKMRNEAAIKSQVLQTLDYGVEVEISDDSIKQKVFEANVPKTDTLKGNWALKGHWVKIKFKEKGGYVFDAYLSKMLPFKRNTQHFFETKVDYLQRVYGKPKHKSYKTKKQNFEFENDDFYYQKDIIRYEVYGDGCFDHAIEIPNISLEEAYLFLKALFYEDDKGDGEMKLIQKDKNGYLFNETGATQLRGIKIKNGIATIFSSDCS